MSDAIEIEIINWSRHNPRSSIKAPRWFALSNRLFEDPDFYDFSHSEIIVWMYILCQASQKNSAFITVRFAHAMKIASIKQNVLTKTLEKLEKLQCIQRRVHDMNISVHGVNTTCVNTTQQYRTEQNKTGQDSTPIAPAEPPLHPLAEVWNNNCGTLGKVREVGKERLRHIAERMRECPSLDTWTNVVKKISASDFCNGRVEGKKWKATFDFLLRPKTRVKALEGAYDNFDGPQTSSMSDAEYRRREAAIFADQEGA